MPEIDESLFRPVNYPQRIICLTEETTETIYLLGEGERIVGVSGYTVRPIEARQKPKVSAFTSAKLDKIIDLKPDLVLAFSDLQADIVQALVRSGITVVAYNQRSIKEILAMILSLGALIGCPERAQRLVAELQDRLSAIVTQARALPYRPRVYFEEWGEPLIAGIRWVSELIEVAGGVDIFAELRPCQSGRERIINSEEVIKRDPELIIASWCGRKVNKSSIINRPGWESISAVKKGQIFEVKSTIILQPGPAALTDGIDRLHEIIKQITTET